MLADPRDSHFARLDLFMVMMAVFCLQLWQILNRAGFSLSLLDQRNENRGAGESKEGFDFIVYVRRVCL